MQGVRYPISSLRGNRFNICHSLKSIKVKLEFSAHLLQYQPHARELFIAFTVDTSVTSLSSPGVMCFTKESINSSPLSVFTLKMHLN